MAKGPEKQKLNEVKESPDFERPIRLNERISPVEGRKLARIRYQELAKDLLTNKATNEVMFTFQWKPHREEGFNESEHIMKAKGTLNPDKSLKLEGEGWTGIIRPDGKIEGEIPTKLIQFLAYNRVKYDEKYEGKVTHKVKYVKQGFGSGGHAIITKPIYRDIEQEHADEILAGL